MWSAVIAKHMIVNLKSSIGHCWKSLSLCSLLQFAAQQLHQDAKQWDEKDNNMVAAAKKMAKLMLQMSQFAKYV